MSAPLPALQAEMERRWSPERLRELQLIGKLSWQEGAQAHLVGGAVRDLLLHRPVQDWDIAVEGDVERIAARLVDRSLGYRICKRSAFGTMVLASPTGLVWDLARCRTESYPHPAALPVTAPASLREDLYRRDYRVNAMAIALDPKAFGGIEDPYGGRKDLEQKILSVLHPRSFLDDPTRILRGLRFHLVLGFRLDPQADHLRAEALEQQIFSRLSGTRLWRELERLLALQDTARSLATLRNWGLGGLLPPVDQASKDLWKALAAHDQVLQRFQGTGDSRNPADSQSLLLLLGYFLGEGAAEQEWSHWQLSFPHGPRQLALLRRLAEHFPRKGTPAAQARCWRDLGIAGILAALAIHGDPALQESAWDYLERMRYEDVPLDGRDLQALGVPQGPGIGRMLARLQDARWNGEFHDRDGARKWLKENGLLTPP